MLPAFTAPFTLTRLPRLPPPRRARTTHLPLATVGVVRAARAAHILRTLLDANAAYAAGRAASQAELSPPALRRALAADGQAPDVAIIACADSRVAPEIVFGAGIGRIFVVRNAGNVAWDDSVVGSLEFAVGALQVPLVLVLGHSMCGAVQAAVGFVKEGGEVSSPLMRHVGRLAEVVRAEVGKPDEVHSAVVSNVRQGVASLLRGDTSVARLARSGDIMVAGAVYDIETGKVTMVDP